MEKTISYVSGGKLGDFIQQMSIIYERYLLDNKKVILYISDRGDTFRHGIKKAYEDLYPIVSRQFYIEEFKIHCSEPYDLDLSSWRKHIWVNGNTDGNYIQWIKNEYNIDWGKHQWLYNIPTDHYWENKIVLNTTKYRFPDMANLLKLLYKYKHGQIIFVGFDFLEHEFYKEQTDHSIRFYSPSSLLDFSIIINSCQSFIGSLSAPLSLALALHVPCEIGFSTKIENNFDCYKSFHNINKNINISILKEEITNLNGTQKKDYTKKKMPIRLQKYLRKK